MTNPIKAALDAANRLVDADKREIDSAYLDALVCGIGFLKVTPSGMERIAPHLVSIAPHQAAEIERAGGGDA